MYITELAKDSGASVDQIRYLEKKGFVESTWIKLRKRKVRFYSKEEATKVRLIIKYLDQGFRYDVANEKATKDIQNPQLELVGDEDK